MLFKKNLRDIYIKYLKEPEFNFGKTILDKIPEGKKKYKNQILALYDEAIQYKNSKLLQFCIGASLRDGIDNDYKEVIHKVILETWHNEHEDIVDIIYDFKDDIFVNALLKISKNPEIYRQFDDENEATLRKCIHALKIMNTERSNEAILELINTKNQNVFIALEMYK